MKNLFEETDKQEGPKLFISSHQKDFPKEVFLKLWQQNNELQDLYFFPSSGSESDFKLYAFSKDALLTSARAVNEHIQAQSNDSWLLALPTHHMGGFSIYSRASLSKSLVFELNGQWNPESYVTMASERKCTLSSLVPTQIYDLVKLKIPSPRYLRAIFVGGAALDESLLKNARSLGWPLLPTYGMTECASQIATQEAHLALSSETRASFKVLPLWRLNTDSENRLEIKGEALFSACLTFKNHFQEIEIEHRSPNAAYISNDCVELQTSSKNLYLKFLGRVGSTIKIAGEWVQMNRLQSLLDSIIINKNLAPEFCLLDIPDERWGRRVALVHEKNARIDDLEQLENAFNAKVLGFEKIHKKLLIDRIPRTSLSKISYTELRKALGIA